jgi:aryl-alcohol dehydrogenase-like predicted oxidoreductase
MTVSALGVGCATLGAWWHGRSGASWKAAVEAALASGITLFDTADIYGMGRSERLLGDLLRERSDVIAITKAGMIKTPASVLRALTEVMRSDRTGARPGHLRASVKQILTRRKYLAPGYIVRSVHASQRRLRRTTLDVFLLHSPPVEVLEDARLLDALHQLRRSGQIKAWGVSARTMADGEVALQMPGIDCVEVRLDLCDPAGAGRLVAAAEKRGVGVIARQPMGSGEVFSEATNAGASIARPPMDSLVRACVRYPLSMRGVAAVVVGMSRATHVRMNASSVAGPVPANGEIDEVRRWFCGGRDVV